MNGTGTDKDSPPLPLCATLAIGTLPHQDTDRAVDLMIRMNPECPAWPQLPRVDFRESMYVQFAEGMPAAVVDSGRQRIYFDMDAAPEAMAEFYEHYLADDTGYLAITGDYARGIEPLLERMPTPEARFLKGQVTGPISFGLTVTDAENKPVLYHDDLFEAIVKALAFKGRWQVEQFRRAAPGLYPVIFYDEPYLTQMGSALISLPPEQISASLNECFASIDGYKGTHVCGGTDWGLLSATGVDILHFDAAYHEQEFLLYEKELAAFMERGGMLGWGVVPTDESVFERKARGLAEQVQSGAERIAGFGPAGIGTEDVLRRSFITQSCGLGSRSIEIAVRSLELAAEISDVLRPEIC